MHVGNVKVQARVVRALTNLSVHETNKPKIATVAGAIQPPLALTRSPSPSPHPRLIPASPSLHPCSTLAPAPPLAAFLAPLLVPTLALTLLTLALVSAPTPNPDPT